MNDPHKNLVSFKSAKKIMLRTLNHNTKTEIKSLKDCEDRILAKDIFSKINVPEFDNSAVDGFGFINSNEIDRELEIIGESKPGKPFLRAIKKNQAIKIYTGAYILKNKTKVNTVCMEEECDSDGEKIRIFKKFKTGNNIRIKGEDVMKKKKIFSSGRKIRSIDLAQLSSLGVKKLKVFKKIRVGIFSSGDELCEFSKKKSKYEIYDANKLVLVSLFKKIGCEVVDLGIIKDNYSETKKLILSKIKSIDVIVTSGGVSKSKTDKVGKFFEDNAEIEFWRLSIKPGRPFAFGKLKNKPFIGLPGNPVAAIITFFMLVVDYIKLLSGFKDNQITERILPCDFEMKKKKGRTEWLRGRIIQKKNLHYLTKFNSTGSGIISSISQSHGIIELDEKKEYIKKGSLLKFYKYEDMLN